MNRNTYVRSQILRQMAFRRIKKNVLLKFSVVHVWLHVSADTIQRNNQLSFAWVFHRGLPFVVFD